MASNIKKTKLFPISARAIEWKSENHSPMDVNAKLVSPELHSDRYKLQLRCRAAQRCSASDYKNRTGAFSAPRENQKPAIEVGIAKFIHLRETMSALSGLRCNYLVHDQGLSPGTQSAMDCAEHRNGAIWDLSQQQSNYKVHPDALTRTKKGALATQWADPHLSLALQKRARHATLSTHHF